VSGPNRFDGPVDEEVVALYDDGGRPHGSAPRSVMRANNLPNPNFVYSGQRLLIPDPLMTFAGAPAPSAPQQIAPYSITSSARARVRLGAGGLTRLKRNTGTAVVHIDDDVDNLPFIVRRDHRIVAAFAKKRHANVRKGPDCKTRDTNGGGMLAPP